MPRIQPLKPPYNADIQSEFDKIMPPGVPPLNIFATVAKNPRVLNRMMSGGLLDRGSISINARELVILRTCALCKAEYEWGVHASVFGGKAELSLDQIHDTYKEVPDAELWSHEQLQIIRLVDELVNTRTISDTCWKELIALFEEAQLIELVMLCGLYHAVSFTINAFAIELENGMERFNH